MNKIFPIVLISFVVVITIFLCIVQPKPLKQVVIADSSFNVQNKTMQQVPVSALNINNVNTTTNVSNTQIVNKNVTTKAPTPVMTNKNVVKNVQTVKTSQQNVVKSVPVKTENKPVTSAQKTQVKSSQKPVTQTKQPVVAQKTVQQPVATSSASTNVKQPTVPPVQSAPKPEMTQKVLTEQEETIAWNAWRSRVDNEFVRLYNATKVSLPAGTKLIYSFNVDKYKNITNITIKTDPVKYQATAQAAFVPMIAKMNGKSFLTFPEGTRRTSVVVNRSKTVSNSNYYTKPSDFSDYEKVKTVK